MKVLLRHTRTGMFYAGPENWTEQHSEAAGFDGPDRALDEVNHAGLEAVEVVIHFENSSFDIPLTIVSAGQ
jgi:hypothetical protein